tara:strand:- start:2381 stop:2650 length:270 start_codon:yes stop_codon:yes gene_type:complete
MGDVGEDYKAWKEMKKKNKTLNLTKSTQTLISMGIDFESKNDGLHLVVKSKNGIFDFYPSTGLYTRRGVGQRRGVSSLIREIQGTERRT